jgi:type IV secretory pathway TrbL component
VYFSLTQYFILRNKKNTLYKDFSGKIIKMSKYILKLLLTSCQIWFIMLNNKLIKLNIFVLIKSGGGTGPMKPGNQYIFYTWC